MADANEPTADISPTAPKQDRFAKARAAKAAKKAATLPLDRTAQLEAQVAKLTELVEKMATGEIVAPMADKFVPGEYFVGGTDAATGRAIYQKRRWNRPEIIKRYPPVTFFPMHTMVVNPHGISWELEAGKEITVPSIVKDLYENAIASIERQTRRYQINDQVERGVFEAARQDVQKGRHFTPLAHVGYGWPLQALQAAGSGKSLIPDWEPEVGFPGGYDGKPIPPK